MHDLEAHPLTLFFPETAASGNVRKAVYLAGSPDSAAFAHFSVVLIVNVLHGKTGAGGTDKIAAAAADAAVSVFLPERTGKAADRKIGRQSDFFSFLCRGIGNHMKLFCIPLC